MDKLNNSITVFLIETARVTGIQILGIFGIFFVLGFFLSIFQRWTNLNYRKAFGWKGILWTAWIGTPIHELGHYIFAIIFRHNIVKIALFKPNEETGGLGHVDHSFKKSSIYQTLGNFFIGAAPMIFGTGILYLLLLFLHPNGKEIINTLTEAKESLLTLLKTIPTILSLLFLKINLWTWQYWLFFYLSFAISAHIAPSKQDRKGMWSGFFWIFLIIFLINFIALSIKQDITLYILKTAVYLNILTAVSIYALALGILHYIFTILFIYPITIIKKRKEQPMQNIVDIPIYDKRKNK